jgi:hypothetical protein
MIVEGEMWLKGQGQVDTLCHGEVAERLNAAVSKTVTSVTPASGVRIPPSPLSRTAGFGFRASGRRLLVDALVVRSYASETRMMLVMVLLRCPGILV